MSDAIKLKGELSRDRLAAGSGHVVHVLLQVQADALAAGTAAAGANAGAGAMEEGAAAGGATTARLPLNIAAVIDRSGSMSGPPIEAAKQAASFLVGQLTPADCLGLVIFDHEIETVFQSGPVAFKEPLREAIKGLWGRGNTNLSGGLVQGGREVRRHLAAERVNRVLLLTDGQANEGVTHLEHLAAMARQLREDGILVTTMGSGDHFDEDLLAAMADAGGGNFHYIADAEAIPGVFAKELDGLLAVAAQGLTVTVRVPEWVSIHDVYGFPCQLTPREAVINLPDIYTGEVKSIVLALEVGAQPAAGVHELLQAELTYHDVRGGKGDVQLGLGLSVTFAAPDEVVGDTDSATVMKEVHQAEAARAMERAIEEADRGNFAGSQMHMQAAFSNLSNYEDDAVVGEQLRAMETVAMQFQANAYDASARKSARQLSRDAYVGRRRRQ